jgi:hypothetical protein
LSDKLAEPKSGRTLKAPPLPPSRVTLQNCSREVISASRTVREAFAFDAFGY